MNVFEEKLAQHINKKDFQNIVKHIIDNSKSVLDIGCGIGDYLKYTNENQKVVAVEPHAPYIEIAKKATPWAIFNNVDALSFFKSTEEKFDCILLIDVVEHLDYKEAIKLVEESIRHSNRIVFSQIPIGLHEQHDDHWHLGGEVWQEHRSTWYESNIEELGFTFYQIWKDWYEWKEGDTKSNDTSVCFWFSENIEIDNFYDALNEVENLADENFMAWQEAYVAGYNSSMGDHTKWFYNIFIESLGFYDRLKASRNIIEYAPGNGDFVKGIIDRFPDKKYHLLDISEMNLSMLKERFSFYPNVKCHLNHPEIAEISDIDFAFSFFLCQSVPVLLWKHHLKSVNKMLNMGGSYYFQFSVNQYCTASNSVIDAINGTIEYELEEMYKILENAGFIGVDVSLPISLETDTNTVWYICRAYK